LTGLSPEFLAEYGAAETDRARWKIVGRYFHVQRVASNRDLRPGVLYFVHAKESHLIRSGGRAANVDPVPMTVVPSGQPMKPVARKQLLAMGRKSQLLKLSPRATRGPSGPPEPARADADEPADAAAPRPKGLSETVIEMGSFTQLLTVAAQSAIVPAADQIGHVRDCEFRMGHYQAAFEAIDRIYVAFKQAADQRKQRLRVEEIDYRSGVLKMSPKEWQQKKARDTMQTNVIERARRNFVRVLDGLRVLMLSQ
jgi:hypothetical protein